MAKKTTEQCIKEASILHNNRYDYSASVYSGSMKTIKIVCPLHGEFTTTPNLHLSTKAGCQKCVGKHRPMTEECIQRSKDLYTHKFTYDKTVYGNNQYDPVTITCREHGDFQTTPSIHFKKLGGCKLCAKSTQGTYHKSTVDEFVTRAKLIHDNKYDYSDVVYTNCHTKVSIRCPEHGVFEQTPASHVNQKNGCNLCSFKDYQGGFNYKRFKNHPEIKPIPATLYLVRVTDNRDNVFCKIGITQKALTERFSPGRVPSWKHYEVVNTVQDTTYSLFLYEQSAKRVFKPYKYKPECKFDGHTECFDVGCEELLKRYLTDYERRSE